MSLLGVVTARLAGPASERPCVSELIAAGRPSEAFGRARSDATSIRGSANSQASRAASLMSDAASASANARLATKPVPMPATKLRRLSTMCGITKMMSVQ